MSFMKPLTLLLMPSDTSDTDQTPEIANQSAESLDKTHVAPMGTTGQPRLTTAGCPKRTHRLPLRYANNVCSSLIGRPEPVHGRVPRTACTCNRLPFTTSEAISTDVSPLLDCFACCSESRTSCVYCDSMPKRARHGAPDKDGWCLVGTGRGRLPAPDDTVSAGRSVPTA